MLFDGGGWMPKWSIVAIASSNLFHLDTANVNYYGISITISSNSNTLSGNTTNYNNVGFILTNSSSNTLSGNKANYNVQNGFSLNTFSNSNTLTKNSANKNGFYGYRDDSTGSGTLGTANSYSSDTCSGNGFGGSSPSGLGSPQP